MVVGRWRVQTHNSHKQGSCHVRDVEYITSMHAPSSKRIIIAQLATTETYYWLHSTSLQIHRTNANSYHRMHRPVFWKHNSTDHATQCMYSVEMATESTCSWNLQGSDSLSHLIILWAACGSAVRALWFACCLGTTHKQLLTFSYRSQTCRPRPAFSYSYA
jgi:hypothetical protein